MGAVTDIVDALLPYEEQLAIQVVMGALETAVPFFSTPIVSAIIQFFVSKFIDYIVVNLNLFIVNIATIVDVGLQQADFFAAAQANMAAQTNGTQEQKDAAVQALLVAARKFIKLGTP